ncbi:methyltransferase [Gordonia sp. ABSL1-1]|uniref:50S ribosomal protein L11 methyltransferase n=1 Tax=Gordonia sp. ABSL1-1 TaxID=3053923 RepID=UPI0025745A16|nr:50S ribosomal protein L11 methyltransferase [Gordonia sp. ABSL1-1]MDL9935264.1 methyltransferase [Gordonia sp. ABSL1-1]
MTVTLGTTWTSSAAQSRGTGSVYRPQQDSRLLIDAVRVSGCAPGARAADLCTGSGIVARECAVLGAQSVLAVDSSPAAVEATRRNCADVPAPVTVMAVDLTVGWGAGGGLSALSGGAICRFDLVTCNPPYVPCAPNETDGGDGDVGDPRSSWDAGEDGRAILDPLCDHAADLLNTDGALFVVQSEFADVRRSVEALRRSGLRAGVVRSQWIPFGPVLRSQADWLENRGVLEPGRRVERISVIRADKSETRRREV